MEKPDDDKLIEILTVHYGGDREKAIEYVERLRASQAMHQELDAWCNGLPINPADLEELIPGDRAL